MAKVASATATKRASSPRNTAAPLKPRSRATKEAADTAPPPIVEPSVDSLQVLTERLSALEEKVTASLSALTAEVQNLQKTTPPVSADGSVESETVLPIVGDLIRRHLMEHLNPLIASLKRIEERVGFIGNRLKHPGGNQEQRQKPPWRHDQQRHNSPRGHNGAPRPGQGSGQGQQWTPPSAASVQGHFAPRPLRGGEIDTFTEDEE
ncbi:MAG: hypothetical protein FJ147_07495 [Deltaproteobacteria bacterium]|nr:hypothetical protein [Deltaproteobacteria bacterium]